jgi:hypothetical protein
MQPDKGGTATVRRAYREDIDWLRAAFRIAGLTTAGLLAGSTAGIVTSQAPSDADRAALQLESYNAYNFQPLYRFGSCFAPSKELFDDACLAFVSGKDQCAAVGRQLGRALFPWHQQDNRAEIPEHSAGNADAVHADAECGSRQCAMPQPGRANGRILARPQARPRHHVR